MRQCIAFFLILFGVNVSAGPLYDYVFSIQDEFTDMGSSKELAVQFLQQKSQETKLNLAECYLIADDIHLHVRLNPQSLKSSNDRVTKFFAAQKTTCENIKTQVIGFRNCTSTENRDEIAQETRGLILRITTLIESSVCNFTRESCFDRSLIDQINCLELEWQLCTDYCPKTLTGTLEDKVSQLRFNYINELRLQAIHVMFPDSPAPKCPILLANIDRLISVFDLYLPHLPDYQSRYDVTSQGLMMRLKCYRNAVAGAPQATVNNYGHLMLDICAFLDRMLVDLKCRKRTPTSNADDDDLEGFELIN